jgi:hypothetical protein
MAVTKQQAPKVNYANGWGEVKELVLRPRLIVSARGEDKDGKTQFGLSMPAPIAVFAFDNNTAEIVNKVQKYKKILVPNEPLEFKDAASNDAIVEVWARFKTLYMDAVNSSSVRSILIDTGTDLYELMRLAILGKLEQVPPHFYGKVNVQFHDLVKKIHPTDKNLCITHRLKDEYIRSGKDSARTGTRILSGVGDIRYKVQVNVLCWRDLAMRDEDAGTQGFAITVDNCTQNETLAGTYIEEPDNTWVGLGMRVYPSSTEKDWQ